MNSNAVKILTEDIKKRQLVDFLFDDMRRKTKNEAQMLSYVFTRLDK